MPEWSALYELVGPDGSRAVWGNSNTAQADPDWIGPLDPDNGIQGLLDGADVRETATDLPEADGASFGPSWLGRRSGTFQGLIDPSADAARRNALEAKLKRASRCLRADGSLRWTPTNDSIQRELRVRRQAKPQITGRRPKAWLLALASAQAYVLSANEDTYGIVPSGTSGELGIPDPIPDPITSDVSVAGSVSVTNQGDAETWPRFVIEGPITNPKIVNNTTDKSIRFSVDLAAGETLWVYSATAAVLLGGTADKYDAYDFAGSEWWQLVPGPNDIRVLPDAFSTGALVTIYWRHAYE